MIGEKVEDSGKKGKGLITLT